MKRNAKLGVCIALLLCFISSVGASVFQTNFGAVKYHDLTIEADSGHKLDALLLVPETATDKEKAPGIVVSHGWYNNREMQDLNYVEYARRGYVVLAISMYGHGDSEVIDSGTWWDDENNANGLYDAVKYLSRLSYVDADKIGVTGHSNGALACREAVLQDDEGLISAVLLVSNDAVYKDKNDAFYNMFGSRDAAIVACQYDEFFHRVDGKAPREFINQSTAQSFLNFGADPKGLEARTADVFYEKEIDGENAVRAIYNPAITHPWAHFSSRVVSFSVNFFDRALGAPNELAHTNQIWQYKAAFNAIGSAGFFMLVLFLTIAMLDLPFFRELKVKADVVPWPEPEDKVRKKMLHSQIIGAVMSIPAYLVAFAVGFLWQSSFWNQGASRVIGIWSVLCGLITLITLRSGQKRNPIDKAERGITLSKQKLIKTIVLSLIVIGASFMIVYLSDHFLLTDYRLWCFATIRAFGAQHLGMILRFVPMWLFYYIIISVSGNCIGYIDIGKSRWKSSVLQMLFVFLGPQIMIMAQYITFFITGKMLLDPLSGIMGIWLFPIVLILPLASFISHMIYKKTKNPYLGGIIMGIIACILTVTNTLTG